MPAFIEYLTESDEDHLSKIANSLVTHGKGILCADELPVTMTNRFACIGLESTEENRRRYRELLFTSDGEMSDYISGVILHHETMYQNTADGLPFVKLLIDQNILPGVKVDTGLVTLPGTDENTTQGIDGLGERCAQYKKDGASFTKFRCTLKIGDHTPSYQAMIENTNILGRYASICQQNGLVPMIEQEVVYDGDHDLYTAQKVTERALAFMYKSLSDHNVYLEGTLVMPNMVTAGPGCKQTYTLEQNGKATLTALRRTVPSAVPGVVFLSGGHSEEESTLTLNAINQCPGPKPWTLSFSFGRALQASAIKTWKGDNNNKEVAQKMFLKRAKANGLASMGRYRGEMTSTTAEESLSFVAKTEY